MEEKKDNKQAPQPWKTEAGNQPMEIDLDGIKKLLALMDEHNLVELEMEQADMAVRLKKRGAEAAQQPFVPTATQPAVTPPQPQKVEEEELVTIKSPMVGTFYAASSPDAEPFVKVGDTVNEDTVVCIIEAMKVFNEIRAETAGTITKVCVKNGGAVEFGQALFMVRPA